MNERVTVFQRPSDAQRESSSGFGLPRDLLEKSRRRVETVAWLILLGVGLDAIMLVGNLIAWKVAGGARPNRMWMISTPVSIMLCVAMIVAARSRHVRNTTLLVYALGFEVLECLIISISNPAGFYQDHQAIPVLTWVTPLIILFPLIVPCPPRRTVITATLAAATAPFGLYVFAVVAQVPVSVDAYFSIAFSPTLAIAIAYFGSRVIYGLGLEVAAAQRLGSYQLERLIGRGGMGEVWIARHAMLARPAAVKLVRPELLGVGDVPAGSRILQRFEREAQVTASMRSPHTIHLYDYGVASDGTFYYVMEYLEGFTAEALVSQFGPLPAERVVHLLRQVCHSLAEAHEAGLIHRDIKPANVYVCRYGRDADFVKVLDFGLVKTTAGAEDTDDVLTAENVICGTPAFMAPEQSMGHDSGDARSDLYAVGCVAYWLLTGEPVFRGANAMEILVHHARTAPQAPSERTELPVPEALDALVLSLLEKDPERRPPSALVLSRLLDECVPAASWSEERAVAWWDAHRPV
jgi:serine/threonine-protein kinase